MAEDKLDCNSVQLIVLCEKPLNYDGCSYDISLARVSANFCYASTDNLPPYAMANPERTLEVYFQGLLAEKLFSKYSTANCHLYPSLNLG